MSHLECWHTKGTQKPLEPRLTVKMFGVCVNDCRMGTLQFVRRVWARILTKKYSLLSAIFWGIFTGKIWSVLSSPASACGREISSFPPMLQFVQLRAWKVGVLFGQSSAEFQRFYSTSAALTAAAPHKVLCSLLIKHLCPGRHRCPQHRAANTTENAIFSRSRLNSASE